MKTAAGGIASSLTPELALRRAVLACLLWEPSAYQAGDQAAANIASLVPKVSPQFAAALAVEARERQHLRHVPLFIVREMARYPEHRKLVAETLEKVIQRADELGEFMAIYWSGGKQPVAHQVKRGLAAAMKKFKVHALQKYGTTTGKSVSIRDVMFLTHPKPPAGMEEAWKKLADNELPPADTWETALSSGADKRETWERLIAENKLGGLALLRNLVGMRVAGVPDSVVEAAIDGSDFKRVLPFRFLAAAQMAPHMKPALGRAMARALASQEKLPGKTVLVVDRSGSMGRQLSAKSELNRLGAAKAMAILVAGVCEEPVVYATGGDDHLRKHATARVSGEGWELGEAIDAAPVGHGGIFMVQALRHVLEAEKVADRVIVLTDEQDVDRNLNPAEAPAFGKKNYLVNVSNERNGIAYGKFVHIDGWSEAVVEFVRQVEQPVFEA